MKLLRVPFSLSADVTSSLVEEYDKNYKKFKKGELSFTEQFRFHRIRKEIERRLIVVEVTPEKQSDIIIQQMAGMDVVHKFGTQTQEELKTYRLGGKNANKTAYALIDPLTQDVYSAIYVYRSDRVLPDEEISVEEAIPGHVGFMIKEPLRALKKIPSSLIFYSISGFGKMAGEGELLISKLHKYLNRQYGKHSDIVFTTLSPMRGLKGWLLGKNIDPNDLSEGDLLACAADYLFDKNNKDKVERFHLSNGAEILGVRLNANYEGTEDDTDGCGVMVHYRYPNNPYHLIRNALAFAKGQMTVSPYFKVPEPA